MSSFDSDEHLVQFRLQSDKAFLEMQTRADREMASFLKEYSADGAGLNASFVTTDMTWGVAPPLMIQAAAAPVRRKVKKAAEAVGKAVRKAKLSGDLKEDLQDTAHEAVSGTQGWLRHAGMDLGERAKREAAAMREAARKAMSEETSLRGLKERAQKELEAAKQRMKHELQEAGAHAANDLEALAVDTIGEIGEHGLTAAEAAQKKAEKEFDELLGR